MMSLFIELDASNKCEGLLLTLIIKIVGHVLLVGIESKSTHVSWVSLVIKHLIEGCITFETLFQGIDLILELFYFFYKVSITNRTRGSNIIVRAIRKKISNSLFNKVFTMD